MGKRVTYPFEELVIDGLEAFVEVVIDGGVKAYRPENEYLMSRNTNELIVNRATGGYLLSRSFD